MSPPNDDVESRVPPAACDIEAAILSICLIDPEAMRKVLPMLRADDFYSEAHRRIYEACTYVHQRGEVVDVLRVAQRLKDTGRIGHIGGMSYLTEVLAAAVSHYNVVAHAKTVRSKARLRDLIRECQKIQATAYAPHGDDTELLLKAGDSIREITRVADRTAMSTNHEALREVFLKIQESCNRGDSVTGIRTGIDLYDRQTTGLHGKQLTIVAARPGQGKSALLLQIADHVASQGIGTALFSLEMTKAELTQRQISMRSGVDSRLLEIGALTKEQWAAVTAEVGKMSDLPMKTDDSAEITINQLRERALGAIDDGFLSKKPIGLILVDYIQRMRVPQEDKRKNRHEQVEDMARGLKELAKSTGLPVVAAAQLKRIPEGRPGRRPTMDDLRESGGLESEADVVCLIHRGHQYDAKIAEDDAELLIDKNRHGQPGLINVRWHAALTRFDNLDSGHMST